MSAQPLPENLPEDFDANTPECPVASYLDNYPDQSIGNAWIGTDGAGQGEPQVVGAGVVFKRRTHEIRDDTGECVKAVQIPMSKQYGAKVQTVRDAELRVALVGLSMGPDAVCPLVMDAQTE